MTMVLSYTIVQNIQQVAPVEFNGFIFIFSTYKAAKFYL